MFKRAFKLALGTLFVLAVQTCLAADINWQPYSSSIFAKAKKQHSLVLLFGKATWCPWCRRMKSDTFTDSTVINLINKHYIPVSIDIDDDSSIASRYQMSVVPVVIILDGDYKIIDSKTGYMGASSMASFLRRNAAS